MSHLVDGALRDTPASCLAASDAALVSAWDTLDSASSADKEPSADQHTAGTGMASQQSQQAQQGIAASCQPQEHDEQAQKGAGSLKSGASVRSVSNKKPSKPAWALTADAAKDAEQQEEEDLLAFAGGLEFDDYINQQEDAELRTVLQV